MAFVDRYRSVGYAHNPFNTESIAASAVFMDRGINPPAPGARTLCQLVGDRGFGKSTHIRRWQQTQPGPHHYIPLAPYSARCARPPTSGDTVYGDEIDRMPALLRWRWLRSLAKANATVVIGTHVDLRSVAKRAGFTVTSHFLVPLERDEVGALIERHLDTASIGNALVGFDAADIDYVYEKTCGIPRQVETICHGLMADKVKAFDAHNLPSELRSI